MSTPARLTASVSLAVVMVLGSAASALADAPVTWEEEQGRSTLDALLYFGGGTVGLFVLVTLFGLLTARNNYVPPPPSTEIAPTSH